MLMPTNPSIGVYQNQPTDINFLNTHRFRIVLRRAPSVVYFVQECNLPAMSLGAAIQPTPFVNIPRPGDKLQYEDLSITFPVDQDMGNYREIADWMVGLGFPQEFGQYNDLEHTTDGIYSEIYLLILDSSNNVAHTAKFTGCFPTYLSQIQFRTTETDTVIPMVTATFKYQMWSLDEVNEGSTTITLGDVVPPLNVNVTPSNLPNIVIP
jgi:hypothetical protein